MIKKARTTQYLNTRGELVIATQAEGAELFHQRFAEVMFQGKTQRIDKHGQLSPSSPAK